jgi:prevent-host-death family protein
MKTVAVFEAKSRLSELLAEVESGEQITITRHGTPVAKLVPVIGKREATDRRQHIVAALADLKRMRKGFTLEGDITAIGAEGRD